MAQETLSDLFLRLHSSSSGLSGAEAAMRLDQTGPNEPATAPRSSLLRHLIEPFSNPLILMLLLASAISAFLGQWIDTLIIVLMVLMSAVLNFVQTYRSLQAAERLRDKVAPSATVLRDGSWAELPRRALVPGDVLRLAAGDLVPADARLIRAVDLHVQQSALTGESLPAEKEAGELETPSDSPVDARNMVFLGTSVVSGTATALVVRTGPQTAFGDIAGRLSARAPETEFERGIKQFGGLISRTVFFLVLFVFLISAVRHRGALESLLFAVALAVGLIPEFLPMISSVTLAQGAVHMARRKVIVKNLAAIQNFGSIDILCSDKTGTLTTGAMVLDQHTDPSGASSEHTFMLAYLNSFFETGIKHPINAAILSSRPGRRPDDSEASSRTGNPLDDAILEHGHPDVRAYEKLDEIPFDFERRRLSVVLRRDEERLLITKGAPQEVLECCTHCEQDGKTVPLTDEVRHQSEAFFRAFSAQGKRVLAVAWRKVPEQAAWRVPDERELVLAGYVTFSDPPVQEATEVLETLRRDGVQVKILTGDNELVTRHICAQVGFDPGRIVLGEELEHMTEPALAHVAEQATVFARVSPAQKNRVILALKSRSHVVGYIGDGINDAPSLHTADVGISVASGVAVARDAADIILLEHSLQVLHAGILEGRQAFGNVIKYVLMGTSSNFGNMFSMAGASIFLPFLPMLPTQILLNNFLYDLAQVTIPTDRVDASFVRKPRRWDIKVIRNFMLLVGPISSVFDFLTFFVLLKVLHASETLFHTGWFVESLATQTLVLFVIRTAGNPLASRPSLPLVVTTLSVMLAGALLPFTPVAGALGFQPLPWIFFPILLGMVCAYLALVQVAKRRVMREA